MSRAERQEIVSIAMAQASDAITRSQTHNEIVTLSWTQELADALTDEAEGSVEANGVLEYWGPDWRVHLRREVV